jgi:hypothetical protein
MLPLILGWKFCRAGSGGFDMIFALHDAHSVHLFYSFMYCSSYAEALASRWKRGRGEEWKTER